MRVQAKETAVSTSLLLMVEYQPWANYSLLSSRTRRSVKSSLFYKRGVGSI